MTTTTHYYMGHPYEVENGLREMQAPFRLDEDGDVIDARGSLVCSPYFGYWGNHEAHAQRLCDMLNAAARMSKQEPVAWRWKSPASKDWLFDQHEPERHPTRSDIQPLYTSPQPAATVIDDAARERVCQALLDAWGASITPPSISELADAAIAALAARDGEEG